MTRQYDREWLGKKTGTSFKIRESLRGLIKSRSEETGIAGTRIVEDALILYFHFTYNNVYADDFEMDFDVLQYCNHANSKLCEWLDDDHAEADDV